MKRVVMARLRFGLSLWFLLFLFILRVVGQVLVVAFAPPWLPPMEQWYSALLPYPVLLPLQIALIVLMAKICRDVTAGNGYFAFGSARVGRRLIGLSVIYFAVMIARYAIHMTLHPEARWLGGTIPIIFHFVLATFVLLLGRHYTSSRFDPQRDGNELPGRPFEGNWLTTRRRFLIAAGAAAGVLVLGTTAFLRRFSQQDEGNGETDPNVVNDVHSQLNRTRVDRVIFADSLSAIQAAIAIARRDKQSLSIAGGRHAMGAQQFATNAILLDTTRFNRVLGLDPQRGTVEVEAGIQWPQLIEHLLRAQEGKARQWGIRQKQTGADGLCLGGALSANAHGRGLQMKPLIGDIEAFTLMDAAGQLRACSRRENPELFRLAIGGYGLFGVICSLTLRLAPRRKLRRVVEVIDINGLIPAFEQRIADGFLYGDCQYMTDEKSEGFLRRGVFSCYEPVGDETPVSNEQKSISNDDWINLIYLAHTDKARAYEIYRDYYLSTNGQIYWSDTHQSAEYIDYHRALDRKMGAPHRATEVITEINVPRATLSDFMDEASRDFRKNNVNVIYGTIRLIERDDESFLAWAKQPYACVIFNLHVTHTPEGLEHAAQAFRRLIDMAIRRGGSYYLTYHRHATRRQVEAVYPQFERFLRLKKKYDPAELFQSDWYRHYKKLFAASA